VLAHKTAKTVFVNWGIQALLKAEEITILAKLLYDKMQ
jgi:hypothetical protein